MILGLLPGEIASTCTCEIGVDGLLSIDLDATASCPIMVGQDECAITATGSGGAIDLALGGGSGALSFGTDCDLSIGELEFSVDGEFSTDSVMVNECTLSLDGVACTCTTFGCDGGDPFSAQVSCVVGDTMVDDCINLTTLPGFLEDGFTQPVGRN